MVERQEPNACTGFVTGKYFFMPDIVFCNIPYINLDYLYSAPAILKGVVQQHGFTARTVDFGIELFKICNQDVKEFYQVQSWFISQPTPESVPQKVYEWLDHCVTWLQQNPSRHIGISVFSHQSQVACLLLIQHIKKAGIDSKIILGGRGLEHRSMLNKFLPGTALDQFNDMAFVIEKSKLVDRVIKGDGEDKILQLLGVDTAQSVVDPEHIYYPIPNYDDYELDLYQFKNNEISWPITGSKGCVRNCDFCNVGALFGRYRYRSGQDIAREMIHLNQTIGARRFQFNDSLINGGMKPLREFLEIMADFNDRNPNNEITWGGAWICKPPDQIPNRFYELLAKAGGRYFTIGAESGSDHLLEVMNKKTDVASLFAELEQFRKNYITCYLYIMFGHWAETHEDFLQTLDMLVRLTPYVRSGTVKGVKLGVPTQILSGTPSEKNAEANGITMYNPQVWFCKNNPDTTISETVYRQLAFLKVAQRLNTIDGSWVIADLNNSLASISEPDSINQFYEQHFEKIPSS